MSSTRAHVVGTAPSDAQTGRNELFELSIDLLATLDSAGRFTDLNPACERILGWPRTQLLGTRAIDLLHPDDRERTLALHDVVGQDEHDIVEFENRYRCRDGTYRWLQWNSRRVGDTWYAVARDVTERQALEQRAARDPLTGLLNRTGLLDRLRLALARLDRRPGLVAVLFIDLDGFKVINDGRGHEVGDRILCAAAAQLVTAVREVDAVARFGGDEFVVLVEEARIVSSVAEVAERLVAALAQPVPIDSEEVRLGASIGVALATGPEVTGGALLHEADIAMYRAKARGGNCYVLFDDDARAEAHERVTVERDLRVAAESAQLVLHYQPIIALPEMAVDRCEALIRWEHPSRGLLFPGDFLPIAEETGLIVGIGERVLHEACHQAARWRREGRDVPVTVNVSTRQLDQPGFTDTVRNVLAESGLPAALLCLEITETQLVQNVAAVIPSLDALRRLGVRIAMDDFGSGYSSLGYLRTLPLDIIKIDRSFVRGIVDEPLDRAIVAGIVTLGRETGLAVIAEGVETETLHAELIALGCRLAQGFLYARPKPVDELSLDGYSARVRPGAGDPLVIREFMRQIGVPARVRP